MKTKFLKKIITHSTAFLIILSLLLTSIIPIFSPKVVSAGCSSSIQVAKSTPSIRLVPRVGGVALDQAAKFLADMSDITGAYYDQSLDRIVFVGKKNTSLPKFDKDDLAVAIKAVVFQRNIPWVSLESNPTDENSLIPIYGASVENTKFGKVMIDADYKLKAYSHGTDGSGGQTTSSVPGYKSFVDRYFEKGIELADSSSRFWLTPQLISLSKDDASSAFVFADTKMQVKTEPTSSVNGPNWNQAADEFAAHMTANYDQYASESSIWADLKQLGKIVAVVKWMRDSGIATDFHWARDYAPRIVTTPTSLPKFPDRFKQEGNLTNSISGGAEFATANTYSQDTSGTSQALKTSSQAVPSTKEDIHWTFNKDGQNYEAVAVTADAFRTLGSYSSSQSDFSIPSSGDLNLEFDRVYSSYSGGQYGVGRGWNIYPAMLMDTGGGVAAPCGGQLKNLGLQTKTGGWESFTYDCTSQTYKADDPAYHSKVVRGSDGSYTVTLKDQNQLVFDSQFKLKSVKDDLGVGINYNYDNTGKLVSISGPQSHQLTLSYNNQNLISEVSDWTSRKVIYSYDDQGNLLTVTDPNGNQTKYEYDSNFKLIKVTDRNGSLVLENTYTDEAKLATQKDAASITKTYAYDEASRVLTTSDNLGRITKTKYDNKGRTLETIDPLQNTVKYTYGVEFAPQTITDKKGNKIINNYLNGNLADITYPDNKKVTYTYDTKDRIKQILDERYSPTKITTYTYDALGNLTEQNEAGRITKFTYDPYGEILTSTDPATKKTSWTRNNLGLPNDETDPNLNVTKFEYDGVGRLTKKIDAELKSVSYTYDANGNLLTATDAIGTTTTIYDKENRSLKTTLPDLTVSEYTYNTIGTLTGVKDALNSTTIYGYDNYQNLTSKKDVLERESTYKYDALHRQIESKTPLGKQTTWEFDPNGNVKKLVDPSGGVTSFEYDGFDRVTKKTLADNTTVSYEYDFRGNLTKMTDKHGISTFTYNNFNEKTKETNPYGSAINYTYNPSGTISKVTYPDGKYVDHIYDNEHRLIEVRDWNLKSTKYTYFKNDLIATRSLPNAITSNYSYDGANRLSSLVHKKGTTVVARYDYQRDKVGNITKVTESGSFISTPSTVNPNPGESPMPTPVPVTTGADLVITNLRLDPPNVTSSYDEPMANLYVTVKNQGTVAVNMPAVKFTNNLDLEELPTYITPIVYFDNLDVNLAPGEEKVFKYLTETSNRVGTHTIWAMVDRTNRVAETNENNNAAGPLTYNTTVSGSASPTPTSTPLPSNSPTPSVAPSSTPIPSASPVVTPTPTPIATPTAGKDLVITGVTYTPNPPIKGQTFTANVTVKNQGTVATGTAFVQFALYKDLVSPPTMGTAPNSTKTTTISLGAGQSTTLTMSNSFTTSGPHNIWIMADRGLVVAETNENNNIFGPVTTSLALVNFNNLVAKLFSWVPEAQAQTAPLITTLSYDALGRVTGGTYPNQSKYGYTYDKVGNMTKKTRDLVDMYFYYDNDDTLKQAGNKLYYYDKNGNNIRRQQGFLEDTLYNFDVNNRLVRFLAKNEQEYIYKYDGSGKKIEEYFTDIQDPSVVTRYAYDTTGGLSKLMAETGSNPTGVGSYYIYGVGLMPISQGGSYSTTRDYYLEDGMGNIRFMTTSSGNRGSYMDYDPFGNLWRDFGESLVDLGFKGEISKDMDGKFYLMRARYYDPEIGRFISRDPISGALSTPQSQNPYSFALNNPIIHSDPTGEVVPLVVLMILASGAVGGVTGGVATKVMNPEASTQEVAVGAGIGALIGGASGGTGIGVAAVAEATVLRGIASAGTRSIVSGAVGNVVEAGVSNGIYNSIDNNSSTRFFTGVADDMIVGGLAGGGSNKLYRQVGRQVSLPSSSFGKNSQRVLNGHILSEQISGVYNNYETLKSPCR
jgi:RHS repeat-associated protein